MEIEKEMEHNPDEVAKVPRWKKSLSFWCALGLIFAFLFSLLGYLSRWIPLLEYTTHFKVQYFLVSLICILFFGSLRKKKWAMAGLVCLFINFIELVPWYLPPSRDSVTGYKIRVMEANVFTVNGHHAEFIEYIKEEKPHVLAVLEVDEKWEQSLEGLRELYPYSRVISREDNFGIALFSTYPFKKISVPYFAGTGIPSVYATIEVQNREVTILATHTLPPVNGENFTYRNSHLKDAEKFLASLKGTVIVLGDLNITMWSPYYKDLVAGANLKNARRGFGVLPTWPSFSTFPQLFFFSLPLDHVLVSPDIQVLDCRKGNIPGSDHYPLLVDLIVPRLSNE